MDAVVDEIRGTMTEVARAVRDWQPMLERLRRAMAELEQHGGNRDEAMRFLEWLIEHNFTFLGMRDYRIAEDGLTPVAESGLGILRDASLKVLRSGPTFVESTPQHAAFLASAEPLLVTK